MAFMEVISVARAGIRKAALPIVLVVAAGAASASNIAIFNTGVDAGGNVVADQTVGDLHYNLFLGLQGLQTKAITSASGFPIGPWLPDNTASRWIGPNTNDLDGPAGIYVYRTTFDLTGFHASTAQLTGRWSTDNPGNNIRINGASTGNQNPSPNAFTRWSDFTINSGFVDGVNTLDFVVINLGGPTGLRVEVSGNATPVPVPAALPLLAVALGGLGVAARRRQKS